MLRMNDPQLFQNAIDAIDAGDVAGLKKLLAAHPGLATATDEGSTTLLIRLIDWPGHRPNAAESARALLEAGADVDARRNAENGTPLGGALCTEEPNVIEVLIEFGADVHAPCGWQEGTLLELADNHCENLQRSEDEKTKRIAEIFSRQAGRPVPRRPPVGGSTPLLFVRDIDDGIRYYTERLGFDLNWTYENKESECDDGRYVSIGRGGTEMHLTRCHCEDGRHFGNLSVRIRATELDRLFEEFKAAGVNFRSELQDEPWGLTEFEIEDPDGNWLLFWDHT